MEFRDMLKMNVEVQFVVRQYIDDIKNRVESDEFINLITVDQRAHSTVLKGTLNWNQYHQFIKGMNHCFHEGNFSQGTWVKVINDVDFLTEVTNQEMINFTNVDSEADTIPDESYFEAPSFDVSLRQLYISKDMRFRMDNLRDTAYELHRASSWLIHGLGKLNRDRRLEKHQKERAA